MSAPALPLGVWRRECVAELRRSWRLPQFMLPSVLTPAAFYALFTLALGKPSPEAAAASLAGYGVFASIGPALFGFGAGVAMEREQGLVELKRVSPMPAGAYVAAKLVAAVAATAASLALIYLLSLVGGVRLSADRWAMLAVLHLVSTVPYALIGFGIGMRSGGKGAVAIANALFLGSAVLGGLWIPASLLPAWMRTIGEAVPAYHLAQISRAVVGAPSQGNTMGHAAVVMATVALSAAWAWAGWRRAPD